MLPNLRRFLGLGRPPQVGGDLGRSRLSADSEPAVMYAVGDVHGCLSLLSRLEAAIVRDASAVVGDKWIILLGDLIDRGPQSAQVIDYLLAPAAPGFRRICLAGNHEAAMSAFLAEPSKRSEWLGFGGFETLLSYGIPSDRIARAGNRALGNLVQSYVPQEHIEFVDGLPVLLETPAFVFVHAGLRPGLPVAQQSERDLLWLDDDLSESYLSVGKTVVHGHTPVPAVRIGKTRISVDTEAHVSGRLSAVRLVSGEAPTTLCVS